MIFIKLTFINKVFKKIIKFLDIVYKNNTALNEPFHAVMGHRGFYAKFKITTLSPKP